MDFALRLNRRIADTDDRIDLMVNYTYTIDSKQQGSPASPTVEFTGQAGFNKHRLTGRATYMSGPFSASWQLTHMSKAVSSVIFTSPNPDLVEMNKIPSYTYHDLQFRWDLDEERKRSIYVGVDNVFDKQPPFLPNPPFGNSPIGTETQSDVYDPFGRRFYVGARVGF